MPKKEVAIKHALYLSVYLFFVWGIYRYLFRFSGIPEGVEELIIKPILWLVSVFYLVKKEKLGITSVGITKKNLFPSIYFALALGAFFVIEGVILNFVKYGGINFSANLGQTAFVASLGISLATAITEEITFRGYLFNRVWGALNREWTANILTSLFWGIIHIPIALFLWDLSSSGTLGLLILTTVFGMGSAFVFARTKNVTSSILLHMFWSWPIILFR